MDKLFYRCPSTRSDVAVEVGIDAQSLSRLHDLVVGIQCTCGETHYPRVGELYREAPRHRVPLRLRSDMSGISG